MSNKTIDSKIVFGTGVVSMWTLMVGATLMGTDAHAREYQLNAHASGATIDNAIELMPVEIDVTSPDYVLVLRVRNDSNETLVMHTPSMRCLRGETELPVRMGRFGFNERWLDLAPGETKSVELLCDHGRGVTGHFGLVIPSIVTNPSGDGRTPGETLVTDVVWRLQEDDVRAERQRAGKELACVSYRRPAPKAAPPPVVRVPTPPAAPSRPLAIPGNPPPPPPTAAPAPPPPPAALRKR